MATVALCMIVKDEVDEVSNLVLKALPYIDEARIVVSDEAAFEKLGYAITDKKIHWYYRPWNDRFDEARNNALEDVKSDYWFWLDADDLFNFSDLPKLVALAETNNFDQIMLPYNYARDESGQTIAWHWRERLMRTAHPFKWKGWVHETPITDAPFRAHRVNYEVIHNNTEEHTQESMVRNHKILEAAVKASDDPRYQMYLGTSFASLREYEKAIQVLEKFAAISGNIEDVYRALCSMSECAYHLGKFNIALQYASQAAVQIPEYPQAYRLMAQWEESQKNWHEALEWCHIADQKQEPEGMGIYNPAGRADNILIAMHSEFMLGHARRALKWMDKLPQDHPAREEFEEGLRHEAEAELFISLLPKQRKFFSSDKALYEALTYDIKYDARLNALRAIAEPAKTWSDRSIVILCGEGYEEWGPHTLDKGMGGSEEAVVYLSRELAKLGWEVTVFGAVPEAILDQKYQEQTVHYLPWRELNKNDKFNVFVAWRAPDFTEHVNAKVKLADIHDLIPATSIKPYGDVTYMFKSKYHQDQYKDVNSRVIGNGIKKDQF